MTLDSLPGTLIVLCGLPFSGKTTLARRIEAERSAIRLSPDEWITELLPENWTRQELDRLRDPIERLQWSFAQRLLYLGVDVVIEWGSWVRSERDVLRKGAQAIGAGFELVLLDPPFATLLERMKERNESHPAGTFKISVDELRQWSAMFERPSAAELLDRWPPYKA
jgi:predicted kinase